MNSEALEWLARLSALDVCSVSDALDALGLPPSLVDIRRQSGNGCIVGRAVTVQLREGKSTEDAEPVHLCARAIESADSNSIIIISHPGIDAGGWGGVLTQGALSKGVRCTIINGPTRDIDEIRALDYPVFSTGTTARTARGRLHEFATNTEIAIESVPICPGDYLIADDSGAAVIPEASVNEVLTKAEYIDRREKQMIDALKAGNPITTVLGGDYENLLTT